MAAQHSFRSPFGMSFIAADGRVNTEDYRTSLAATKERCKVRRLSLFCNGLSGLWRRATYRKEMDRGSWRIILG